MRNIFLRYKFEGSEDHPGLESFSTAIRHIIDSNVPRRQDEIYIATHELIINSFEAMSDKAFGEEFSIAFWLILKERYAEITIIDGAGGICDEVLEVSKRPIEELLLKERGRGLLMVNSIADGFSIESGDKYSFFKIRIDLYPKD